MVPIQINSSYAEAHYDDVKDILLHHINRVLNDNGIQKRPKGKASYWLKYSNLLETDLQGFIDNPDINLKPLIVQHPNDFADTIINLFLYKFSYIDETENDYEILYNIFVSSVYESTQFDNWKFINRINIDTCPYCNRNYIYTITKNKKIKPEIDHFYPKSKYPLFALSYHNLIPSCGSCNGLGSKGKKDPFSENLINPYLLKSNDFIFTHKIINVAIINPLVGKSDIEINFNTQIQSHCNIFNLEGLYQKHYDHVLELIIKKRIKYSNKYRQYLSQYDGLKFSNAEIDRMILGNYAQEKEQHKRPLSKLYQDIGIELGLIKK